MDTPLDCLHGIFDLEDVPVRAAVVSWAGIGGWAVYLNTVAVSLAADYLETLLTRESSVVAGHGCGVRVMETDSRSCSEVAGLSHQASNSNYQLSYYYYNNNTTTTTYTTTKQYAFILPSLCPNPNPHPTVQMATNLECNAARFPNPANVKNHANKPSELLRPISVLLS